MNVVRLLLKQRVVRPRASKGTSLPLAEIHTTDTRTLRKPMILQSLDEVANVTPTVSLRGHQLWNSTKLLRENGNLRRDRQACVVGGASAIKRLWREYKIRPNVVYVPDTEPTVASWCLEEQLPTFVVRCSPVDINRQLLSAELADGYAAEFPTPTSPTIEMFLGEGKLTRLSSMLVLVGLRIPSNVGTLIRAAVDMGFESVLLSDCLDPFNEKVLRASEGTVLSPRIRLFESSGELVSVLNSVATEHHLVPLLAVPSQKAEAVFDVAKTLHRTNLVGRSKTQQEGMDAPPNHVGPLLIMGSEARGLRDLTGGWVVPHKFVSVPIANSTVESLNVSVAGSVLIHALRPAAEKCFAQMEALNPGSSSEEPLKLT